MRYCTAFPAAFRRIRTAYQPHPPLPRFARWGTFPKGEGIIREWNELSMKTKEITRMALLTAIALTIFMVELQLPGLSPVPGVKLGLSNIVTVWAVFVMGPKKAAMILAARVFLGAVFSGQMSTILYSGAGGACAIGITILSRNFLTRKQIWVAGVLGSIAHCIGQMAVAIGVTLTPGLAAYLPVMIGIGIFTGAFTGLCAQFLTERLKL